MPHMAAVFVSKTAVELRYTYPVPHAGPGEIRVRNAVVASNPKDYKLAHWFPGYEGVEGSDLAGFVDEVGEGVAGFAIGNRVAAFSPMRKADRNGAYAQYTICLPQATFHVPHTTSFEEASTLPLAFVTAVIGLYRVLGLTLPYVVATSHAARPIILIWGGSTSVGRCASQLAQRSGVSVVAVAGAAIDDCALYGVDAAVDYRRKTAAQIADEVSVAAHGRRIALVFDCISSSSSLKTILEILRPTGGRITSVLAYEPEALAHLPHNVIVERTMAGLAHAGEAELCKKWFDQLEVWLAEGKFRGQRWTMIAGGLGGVAEGLARLASGRVSGEKFVYRVADTVGLLSE